MSTPAITADATGITASSKKKTSGVVDKLVAPDVAAGDHTIVDIPVKYVVPHPRNRKVLDDDVADLVASLKAGQPIINALGVTAAADWNAKRPADLKDIGPREFIITAGGHRRLRAAELAGLATVPCVIRPDFAGAEGRQSALLENLHRKNLDAFEEAEAFAELNAEPYKMSQHALAAATGYNQSHISKRIKLLKLPSTVREQVRLKKLDLADALDLAGVVDNQPVFESALEKIRQWGFDGKRAVEAATREHSRAAAVEAARAKATQAGVPLLDRAPSYWPYSTTQPCRLKGLGIKQIKHRKEPCHAAHVDTVDGELVYTCTEPGRHTTTGDSTVKASTDAQRHMSSSSSGAGSSSDAEQRRDRNALKKTYPARMTAAANLVRGMHNLTDRDLEEFTRRGLVGLTFHNHGGRSDTWKLVVDLVGLIKGDYPTEQNTQQLTGSKVPYAWLQLALAAAHFELKVRANHTRWDDTQRYYLNVLTCVGYEVSDIEHKMLGDKQSIAGEWVPPSPEEIAAQDTEDYGSPCKVCGKRDHELEPAVVWVDENLCSACSDAQEAGWMEPDTQPAYVDGVSRDLQDALRDGTALKAEMGAESVAAMDAKCGCCDGFGYHDLGKAAEDCLAARDDHDEIDGAVQCGHCKGNGTATAVEAM
jgi:ParB/RepB/Spo0J family partition protein